MKYLIAFLGSAICLMMVLALKLPDLKIRDELTDSEVLLANGKELPKHASPNATPDQIQHGTDLALK